MTLHILRALLESRLVQFNDRAPHYQHHKEVCSLLRRWLLVRCRQLFVQGWQSKYSTASQGTSPRSAGRLRKSTDAPTRTGGELPDIAFARLFYACCITVGYSVVFTAVFICSVTTKMIWIGMITETKVKATGLLTDYLFYHGPSAASHGTARVEMRHRDACL